MLKVKTALRMKHAITVYKNGHEVFTTVLTDKPRFEVETLLVLFRNKFQAREGFSIRIEVSEPSVTYYGSVNEYFKLVGRMERVGPE